MRFLTVINTGTPASDVILGFGSGHQVLRWSGLAGAGVVQLPVWIVFAAGETIQWQISASSVQVSLHGQLLSAA